MTVIPVKPNQNHYDVMVEAGAINASGEHLAPFARNGRLFIITDSHVAKHWLEPVQQSLESNGIASAVHILPPGEQTKSWTVLEELTDWLLKQGVERSDCLVALGGGVIGDLTGFAASILKRGCDFVQLPTTLLAQVDSSVGGKTAINSAAGKNLIGSFNQPRFVLIDPAVLQTLPDRELRAGYAEVVKYGLIDSPEFFEWCSENHQLVMARDSGALSHAIVESVRSKAAIVAEDEKEMTGKRALLNLGHTFGHALEAETGYSEKLVHGEAVAAGMAFAFHYSARRGHCGTNDALRVADHLKLSGLPYNLESAGVSATGKELVEHMRHDKKMDSGTLPFLLANGIGKTFLAKDVDLDDVADFLDQAE